MNQTAQLNLSDCLHATSEASRRTRHVIIVLVATSVLALSGFLNSMPYNWNLQRFQRVANLASCYLDDKQIIVPRGSMRAEQYKLLYDAFAKSFVENTYTIHVPFFGIKFDVNDLGPLSGVAFSVILLIFKYCLTRENENLILSFREFENTSELRTFYKLLSMQQVLTIPPLPQKREVAFLNLVPQLLAFLPLLVYTVVMVHDFATSDIGEGISSAHTVILLLVNSAFWLIVLALTTHCFRVWRDLDETWKNYGAKAYGDESGLASK